MMRIAFFVALVALSGISHAARPLYTHAIPDQKSWNSLAARPQSASAARTEVVKFILDTEDGRRLWFMNTNRYPVHYFFVRDHIPRSVAETRDHEAFNRIQY